MPIYMSLFFFFLNYIVFIFYYSFFVMFCPSAAVAHQFPYLWDKKGILILIKSAQRNKRWSCLLLEHARGAGPF